MSPKNSRGVCHTWQNVGGHLLPAGRTDLEDVHAWTSDHHQRKARKRASTGRLAALGQEDLPGGILSLRLTQVLCSVRRARQRCKLLSKALDGHKSRKRHIRRASLEYSGNSHWALVKVSVAFMRLPVAKRWCWLGGTIRAKTSLLFRQRPRRWAMGSSSSATRRTNCGAPTHRTELARVFNVSCWLQDEANLRLAAVHPCLISDSSVFEDSSKHGKPAQTASAESKTHWTVLATPSGACCLIRGLTEQYLVIWRRHSKI